MHSTPIGLILYVEQIQRSLEDQRPACDRFTVLRAPRKSQFHVTLRFVS